ncbi:MAG TPA: type II secretion system F family protein [Bryobacterales bacterium]|jgi:tight adherence protein C|nr:type II secretion system F family protein [Bryobacterales bacterium]
MTTELWLLIGFFAFVMLVVTGAGYAFVLRPADGSGSRPSESGLLQGSEPEPASTKDILARIVRHLGEAVPAKQGEVSALRKRLISAGYRSPSTVPLFYGLKYAGALLLGILIGWAVVLVREDASAALLPAIAGAGFGYLLPDRILRSMIAGRQERIHAALPDALDLLVLCIEAGQSLDQALIDASTELKRACPDLSSELALTHFELRAGATRAEALRNLARRNPDPELRKLVNVLIQSDRFGTSLGPALRVHARYMRIRAKQKAEEAARKISIKLLFPIFFLIFPCMLMVTAGPAVVQIFTQLLPMISGGQ